MSTTRHLRRPHAGAATAHAPAHLAALRTTAGRLIVATSRSGPRRRRMAAAVAATPLLTALALSPPAAGLTPGELFAVSGAPGANAFLPGLANNSSLVDADATTRFGPSDNKRKLSDDGRYVVFTSQADGLSAADDNRFVNVFVQDRVTGAVTLVSSAAPGGSGEGDSTEPVISGDGGEVAFTSIARLTPQDTDGEPDVYLHNLHTDVTKLVSVRPDGAQGSGENSEPDLSHDGSTVVFTSTVANTFSSADTEPDDDVYSANVATGALTLISRASGSNGADALGDATSPAVSGNGGAVAFSTTATNIDEAGNPDADENLDVYLRSGEQTSLISRASGSAGVKGDSESSEPAISDDGKLVAFASAATKLVKEKVSFASIYLRDTNAGSEETQLVSRQSTTEGSAPGNSLSGDPTISTGAGGVQVAFVSLATNFAAGLTREASRAYVRSIAGGLTTLVSRADGPAGRVVETFGPPSIATVSGALPTPVAFTTPDPELSDEADPHFTNVYVREGTTTRLRSHPPAGSPWQAGAGFSGLGGATGRVISRDGRFVVFVSEADAYRPHGAPIGSLVLVRDLVTGSIALASRADGLGGQPVVAREPAISGDGTKVAFVSGEALVPGVPAGIERIYVRDLATGQTMLASELDGAPANANSESPAISGNGAGGCIRLAGNEPRRSQRIGVRARPDERQDRACQPRERCRRRTGQPGKPRTEHRCRWHTRDVRDRRLEPRPVRQRRDRVVLRARPRE